MEEGACAGPAPAQCYRLSHMDTGDLNVLADCGPGWMCGWKVG